MLKWQCTAVPTNVPAAPADYHTYNYTSEQPPVEADEYARVCAEAADLRRQLSEVNSINHHQVGVALRTDGVPLIHISDVRRSYARLHQVLAATENDALIMDRAADEIEQLRRQLAEIATAIGMPGDESAVEIAAAALSLVDALEKADMEAADLRRKLDDARQKVEAWEATPVPDIHKVVSAIVDGQPIPSHAFRSVQLWLSSLVTNPKTARQ